MLERRKRRLFHWIVFLHSYVYIYLLNILITIFLRIITITVRHIILYNVILSLVQN